MNEDLIKFKTFAENNSINFMVVGSLALKACGLELRRVPEDIDLEVICSSQKEELLRSITDSQGNDFYKLKEYGNINWSNKPYIFKFGNSVFNIWVVKEFSHPVFVWKDYIKYAGISSVLKAKMSLNRTKDFLDLKYIITNLLNS